MQRRFTITNTHLAPRSAIAAIAFSSASFASATLRSVCRSFRCRSFSFFVVPAGWVSESASAAASAASSTVPSSALSSGSWVLEGLPASSLLSAFDGLASPLLPACGVATSPPLTDLDGPASALLPAFAAAATALVDGPPPAPPLPALALPLPLACLACASPRTHSADCWLSAVALPRTCHQMQSQIPHLLLRILARV
jgi:hypothetical protein